MILTLSFIILLICTISFCIIQVNWMVALKIFLIFSFVAMFFWQLLAMNLSVNIVSRDFLFFGLVILIQIIKVIITKQAKDEN